MSRIFGAAAIAVVLSLPAISPDLYAQRGFHGNAGVSGIRPAPAPSFAGQPAPSVRLPAGTPVVAAPVGRQPGIGAPGFAPVGHQPAIGRPGIAPAGRFPHDSGFRQQRTVIVTQPFGFYSPYSSYSPYLPYFSSAPVVDPSVYDQSVYAEPPAAYTPPPAPVASQSEAELSYQVGVLSQQIDQLRQEQAQAQRPAPAPVSSSMPTVLIFRDGHQLEIVNYAIVGDTLWALDATHSTKIAVADLDLDATQRENRGRGLRFPLPAR